MYITISIFAYTTTKTGRGAPNLLASAAAAPHVQLSSAADHGYSVVVAALPRLCVSLHLNVVDVLVAVCLLPQLLDDFVDV